MPVICHQSLESHGIVCEWDETAAELDGLGIDTGRSRHGEFRGHGGGCDGSECQVHHALHGRRLRQQVRPRRRDGILRRAGARPRGPGQADARPRGGSDHRRHAAQSPSARVKIGATPRKANSAPSSRLLRLTRQPRHRAPLQRTAITSYVYPVPTCSEASASSASTCRPRGPCAPRAIRRTASSPSSRSTTWRPGSTSNPMQLRLTNLPPNAAA